MIFGQPPLKVYNVFSAMDNDCRGKKKKGNESSIHRVQCRSSALDTSAASEQHAKNMCFWI
jgi:hypothetical protein